MLNENEKKPTPKKEEGGHKNAIKEVKDVKEMFFNEYGFTAIIETILEGKKPIVGHFPILDILFFYDCFIDELPESFPEFVKSINNYFPKLYDTKFIARKLDHDIEIGNDLERLYFDVFQNNLKPFHNIVLDEGLFSFNFLP